MIRRLQHLTALTFALCAAASSALAGAWTQERGKGQVIVTNNLYYSGAFFDNRGKRQPMAPYRKEELSPYFEYGLRDGLTIGTSLSFLYLYQAGANGAPPAANWGMGDSEFFARAQLWKKDGFALAIQPLLKLPSPADGDTQPRLGGRSADVGLGLSGGYSFKARGLEHYVNIDTGMRHRFGDPKDQLTFNVTLGISLAKSWVLMPQLFTTARTAKSRSPSFTQSSGDDYNLTKLQLSGIYKATDSLGIQLGAFSHVAGRNVGDGDGITLAVWKSF